MTNSDIHLILGRHVEHSVRIAERGDQSIVLLCVDCNQVMMSADAPPARHTREDMQTTVRTLDWMLSIVGEQERSDLEEPMRLAGAFTQATLAAS